MVNVRFKSYGDFLRFIRKAPKVARNAVLKAYPEFAARMAGDYKSATDTLKATGDTVKKVGGQTTKAIGTTAKNIGNVLKPVAKGAGWLGKKIPYIQGSLNVLAPASDLTDRLSGAGMIGAAALGHPIIAGTLVGADMLKKSIRPAVDYLENKQTQAWLDKYQLGEGDIPNAYNLPSQLKPLTKEETDYYNDYISDVIAQKQQEAQDIMNAGNKEIQYAFGDKGYYDINNAPQVPITGGSGSYNLSPVPTQQLDFSENAQNAQQGGLNNIQDNLYLNNNQPSLTGNVAVPNLTLGNIPNYQTWNEQIPTNLNQFSQDVTNELQPRREVQPMQNNAGSDALLQYLQYMNNKNTQTQQANEAILKQYQDAMRADARQNMVNSMVNGFGVFGEPTHKAPIYYVGAKGDLRAIQLDQPSQVTPLPTDTSNNLQKALGEIKLRQAAQTAINDPTQQVLTAQALGDMYGVNPLVFLNSDLAKQYMTNRGNIEQEQEKGSQAIRQLPYTTQGKVIEEQAKASGNLAQEQMKQAYDTYRTMLEQSGMDRRAASQIASQQAITEMTQQNQNLRTNAQLQTDLMIADIRAKSAEQVARQYGINQKEAIQLKQAIESADPYAQMRALGALYSGIGAITSNPREVNQYIEMATGRPVGLTQQEAEELKRQGR